MYMGARALWGGGPNEGKGKDDIKTKRYEDLAALRKSVEKLVITAKINALKHGEEPKDIYNIQDEIIGQINIIDEKYRLFERRIAELSDALESARAKQPRY